MIRQCCRKVEGAQCARAGSMLPVLRFFAPIPQPHAPIEATINMPVCGAHALEAQAEDFLTDESWAELTHVITAQGLLAPSRPRTQLAWVSINAPGEGAKA